MEALRGLRSSHYERQVYLLSRVAGPEKVGHALRVGTRWARREPLAKDILDIIVARRTLAPAAGQAAPHGLETRRDLDPEHTCQQDARQYLLVFTSDLRS